MQLTSQSEERVQLTYQTKSKAYLLKQRREDRLLVKTEERVQLTYQTKREYNLLASFGEGQLVIGRNTAYLGMEGER